MKLVYIASPYTLGDSTINVRKSLLVADKLLELGFVPLSPLLFHFWHFLSPKSWEDWMKIDIEYLLRCDCLLRLEGESKGADEEVRIAKEKGIPVYFSINDLSDDI